MMICERCRADEARCCPSGVNLCYGCASELRVFDAEHQVGQADQVEQASFLCDVPGPYSLGKKLGGETKSEGGESTLAKTATAAGEIAKTVKVVAVIVAVGGVAWVGYALWKASREAKALQTEAKTALLAHPELLRI